MTSIVTSSEIPQYPHAKSRPITLGSAQLGSGEFCVIAGPCSVDTEDHYVFAARELRRLGAAAVRGGIFKMRTRPEAFQGLGLEGLSILKRGRDRSGLPVVTEVVDPRHLEAIYETVDVFQVGARNMYNYELLKELGKLKKPVLLKRAFSAYLDEWLSAADYICGQGNDQVILCERGVRSFDTYTRNQLDLAAIPYLKARTQFPILVDPSHGTGRRELVIPMSLAAAAAGADGLIVEVHPDPSAALSDAQQALTFDDFAELMNRLRVLMPALGRTLFESP